MRSTSVKCLILSLVPLLLYSPVEVQGDYKLNVELVEYKNPSHTQADGDCCNQHYSSTLCVDCSNRFTFCILPYGETLTDSAIFDSYVCGSSPSYSTGLVGSRTGHPDDMSFKEESFIDEQNNITNPMPFNVNGSWPGRFQLVVKIKNWRTIFDEFLVDLIVEDWLLPISAYQTRTLTGLKNISTLIVSAEAICVNGLLCDNCTRICDPSSLPTPVPEDVPPDLIQQEAESSPRDLGDIPTGNQTLQEAKQDTEEEFNSNKRSQKGLTIGLSVIGGLIILVLLTLIVSTLFCCFARKRNNGGSSKRDERQPFLQHTGPHNERYQAATTDEEDQDENHARRGKPAATSNTYQKLPSQDPRNYPDLARTGQSARSDGDYSSEYSVITRQNMDLSPAHSLDDIPEVSDEEEMGAARGEDVESGYNIIRREHMEGYVSEASSEGGEGLEEGKQEVEKGEGLLGESQQEVEEDQQEVEKGEGLLGESQQEVEDDQQEVEKGEEFEENRQEVEVKGDEEMEERTEQPEPLVGADSAREVDTELQADEEYERARMPTPPSD